MVREQSCSLDNQSGLEVPLSLVPGDCPFLAEGPVSGGPGSGHTSQGLHTLDLQLVPANPQGAVRGPL